MAIDVEALTQPLSEESPAGPDMSYDAVRVEIEAVFEKSVSDDGPSGEVVDWRDTIRMIEAQAAETRDIWLPIYLMRAGAKAGALDTVESGAALLAGLVDQMWATVHPQLDEYGFQGRKGPCESLTRLTEFLNPFRDVVLLEHPRLGQFNARDFDRFREKGPTEEGYGMFRALLEETSDDDLTAIIDRVSGITNSIRNVDVVLVANADGDTGTNFQPTYEMLEQVRKSVSGFLRSKPDGGGAGDESTMASSGSSGGYSTDSPSGTGYSGAIESRDDVVRAIDAIAEYYARKEPGSPVPFALRRARDWVSLSFLEVLEDIAPNSLDEARRVLTNGRESEESYSSAPAEEDSGEWG